MLRTNNNLILEKYHDLQFESLVILMDDEIREKLHGELAPCSNEEFLKRYCVEHYKKFGEKFITELDEQNW